MIIKNHDGEVFNTALSMPLAFFGRQVLYMDEDDFGRRRFAVATAPGFTECGSFCSEYMARHLLGCYGQSKIYKAVFAY